MSELVEHLEGWDWDVTTDDVCRNCKLHFTVKDKGNIDAYKPWMHGDFWHKKCPNPDHVGYKWDGEKWSDREIVKEEKK